MYEVRAERGEVRLEYGGGPRMSEVCRQVGVQEVKV